MEWGASTTSGASSTGGGSEGSARLESSGEATGGASDTAAICVLGCRSNSAALVRRTRAAHDAFVRGRGSLIVACGGVAWLGTIEADAIARMLYERGVPPSAVLLDRASRDTRENAIHAAKLLRERRRDRVVVVTCSWHLPRAERLFARAGLEVVEGIGVPPPDAGVVRRSYWFARERVASFKDRLRAGHT